ncbi:hypothetical protein GGTG_03402 [Gaeumannomyces tritici R3-111a-1]|uniref:Nucleoporin POM33 n=1 Tax=Gaeumannomyces tritici (strain R3-111a-1) TaxID=644352 RepID=J3NQ45_GAET3|nr:hypothetical protein GGTG_03402 [Gaeumannomyces tritici R3-111a-1]EJT78301.1 hypothetical protein GGTG_03402 [Gaeumannomyces tritici R3-111a-1]
MAPPPANLPLTQRLAALAQTLQFAWFIGHFILIAGTAKYTLAWITFHGYRSNIAYRFVFLSAVTTYGIVVYKTLRSRIKQRAGPISPLALAADENVQYLVLGLVWLFSPRYILATLPYSIYSFFHVATYARANLIPAISPPKAAPAAEAAPGAKSTSHPVAEMIGRFVKEYYDASMSVVATLEISLWLSLCLSALMFQRRSWILLPIYTGFLRARFSQSVHVQNSFAQLEVKLDNLMGNQGTPPAVRQAWDVIKNASRQFYLMTDLTRYVNGAGAAAPKKSS